MSAAGVALRYVLVVEDDERLRGLYRAALRAAGFAVVAVEDGLDALHHIDSEKPSAIVLDLDLPRVGGRDVQQEVRAAPETQHIPIIVVSGSDTSDLNPDDFACILRKPIDPEQLIAAVRRCLLRALRSAAM
jgi:DNA-binding response OmpR family regulator